MLGIAVRAAAARACCRSPALLALAAPAAPATRQPADRRPTAPATVERGVRRHPAWETCGAAVSSYLDARTAPTPDRNHDTRTNDDTDRSSDSPRPRSPAAPWPRCPAPSSPPGSAPTGTIIGAAVGSVVATVGAAIYTCSLKRTSDAVRRTAAQVRADRTAQRPAAAHRSATRARQKDLAPRARPRGASRQPSRRQPEGWTLAAARTRAASPALGQGRCWPAQPSLCRARRDHHLRGSHRAAVRLALGGDDSGRTTVGHLSVGQRRARLRADGRDAHQGARRRTPTPIRDDGDADPEAPAVTPRPAADPCRRRPRGPPTSPDDRQSTPTRTPLRADPRRDDCPFRGRHATASLDCPGVSGPLGHSRWTSRGMDCRSSGSCL